MFKYLFVISFIYLYYGFIIKLNNNLKKNNYKNNLKSCKKINNKSLDYNKKVVNINDNKKLIGIKINFNELNNIIIIPIYNNSNDIDTQTNEQFISINYEQDTKINDQDTKINVQDTKINEQDTKINVQDTKINEQDTKINEQDTKINVQDNKINVQHNKKDTKINNKKIESIIYSNLNIDSIIESSIESPIDSTIDSTIESNIEQFEDTDIFKYIIPNYNLINNDKLLLEKYITYQNKDKDKDSHIINYKIYFIIFNLILLVLIYIYINNIYKMHMQV
jgi:hypothetical protein